jgi:hypothetical protein
MSECEKCKSRVYFGTPKNFEDLKFNKLPNRNIELIFSNQDYAYAIIDNEDLYCKQLIVIDDAGNVSLSPGMIQDLKIKISAKPKNIFSKLLGFFIK